MLVLYDYTCRCSAKFERLVERDERDSVTCPICWAPAQRQLSAPRLDTSLGVDAEAFPTMGSKWIKNREQRQRIEEARKREHGD